MTEPSRPGSTPERIGKYVIERVLGRGSMGLVYLARDPTIDRYVALKTIALPDGLEEAKVREFRQRFLREARAAGKLNHPCIVTIYEADDGSLGGVPFIAMEYVEGIPWNLKVRQGRKADPDTVLPLFRELASALNYAHRAGVIHRDLKPANIIQTQDGHLKLMDFGIAKVPTSELTREGQFLGTPAYMSPEQIMGPGVDGRSDLFSLGCVLYEMLTCRKPFPGEDIATVTFQILSEEPPSVLSCCPELSPDVDQIVRYLMAKDPERRYASADLLVQDIDAYMAGSAPPHAGTGVTAVLSPPSGREHLEATVVQAPPELSSPASPTAPAAGASGTVPSPPAAAAGGGVPAAPRPSSRRSAPILLIAGGGLLAVLLLLGAAGGVLYLRHRTASEQAAVLTAKVAQEVPAGEAASSAEPAQPAPSAPSTVVPKEPVRRPIYRPRPQAPPKQAPPAPVVKPAAVQPPPPPPQPCTVTYSFTSGVLRGEFEILVDGKPVASVTIHRKFTFRSATYTGTFSVPPGQHTISFKIHTEVQNISETHSEAAAFSTGEKRHLTIVMTKFNKELHFEWAQGG
ncbi:MAG: serine/threonine protein kinase [Acidobacteriota bacterium]